MEEPGAPHSPIGEAGLGRSRAVEKVPPVDEVPGSHPFPELIEVELAQLIPGGADDDTRGASRCLVGIGGELQLGDFASGRGPRDGVVTDDRGAFNEKVSGEAQSRREPDIVGLRLEREAEERDTLPIQIPDDLPDL